MPYDETCHAICYAILCYDVSQASWEMNLQHATTEAFFVKYSMRVNNKICVDSDFALPLASCSHVRITNNPCWAPDRFTQFFMLPVGIFT